MKHLNISLLVIWICLIVLSCFWAWQAFDNMQVISGGGYLYDDNGEVIGMWDGWVKADYPHWMFGMALPIIFIFEMPLWWVILFWGIGFYLGYILWFVYRPCISVE